MALTTALAFLMLGVATMGVSGRDAIPLRLWTGVNREGKSISPRKRFLFLIFINIAACATVMVIMTVVLYRHELDEQREMLQATAQSQARLIEAVARSDAKVASLRRDGDPGYDAFTQTLSQISDAHKRYEGFGKTGEFALARRDSDLIDFILRHRYGTVEHPPSVPFDSVLAEPMRRALEGKSGTMIGLDYKGETVMAAYEPIAELNLGIVAKIDMSEIRAPFIKSGLLAAGFALLVVLAGTTLFFRIGNPIIERLEAYSKDLEKEIEVRKRVEAELQRLSKVFTDSTVPTIIEDLEGNVIAVNNEAINVYGRSREELVGQSFKRVVPANKHDQVDALLRRCRAGEIVRNIEGLRQRKDGTQFPVLQTLSLLTDEEGKPLGVATAAQNITERKEAEEALVIAKDNAEVANRAKSEFLANMSHELRTPMNSILGFTDRLMSKKLGNMVGRRDIQAIEIVDRNAKHLLKLINGILDLSKIEAGRMEISLARFNLADATREAIAQMRPLLDDKPIELKTDLLSRPICVEADRTKIIQVLANLISNAIKYTEQGTITISIRQAKDEQLGPVARISVADTGIGIKPEDIDRLFSKFTQLDGGVNRSAGGTGLGLCIAQEFAVMHGGRIEVQSEFGRGSNFTLVLPLEPRGSPAPTDTAPTESSSLDSPAIVKKTTFPPADATQQPDSPGDRGITILCVDDDPTTLEMLRVTFTKAGYKVLVAKGHDPAIELARIHCPDLICLDIYMPDKDGFDVMASLRTDPALASIPVIVVSISSNRSKILAAGARCCLPKPLDLDELRATVRRVLAEGESNILVVEDDPDTVKLVTIRLTDAGMDVRSAINGREALDLLSEAIPSVILLDLMMPVMDGFEFLDHIQMDPIYKEIPVVIYSAMTLDKAEIEKLKQVRRILTKGRTTSEQLINALLQVLVSQRRELKGVSQ